MTLRVAITGVSGDAGRGAVRGLRSIGPKDEPIWLLGLDASANPPCASQLDGFIRLPLVRDPNYIDALIAALEVEKIDVLLPGIDSEIPRLSIARQRLGATGTKVVLAPAELIEAADDKLQTSKYLSALGISVPSTCAADAPIEMEFPIIAKPRRGHGSQGLVMLQDQSALDAFLNTRPQNYCLQQYIEGPELTIGLLYDSQGVLRDALAMERTLERGRTIRAMVVDTPEIVGFMEHFGSVVPAVGAINAQLRWHETFGPMIFEVNARLSGSTEMRVAIGFNDPLRLARHFGQNLEMPRTQPTRSIVYRSGNELKVERC